jgi:hypothetical protein
MGTINSIFTGIFNNLTNGNIKNVASTVQTTTETITDIPIDLNYQKHLIDAASLLNDNQRQKASARLYCINKLEWEKTKSNIIYILIPIIILIALIILYFTGIYNNPGMLYIYTPIMIFWYIFYLIFYKYKRSIEWNKILLKINNTNEFDTNSIENIDEIFYKILQNK